MHLRLRGRNALSEFRLNKLNQALQQAHLKLASINAGFWHFVSASRALSRAENTVLERILTYGPAAHAVPEAGQLLLVVPRLGTISPWASKATDIARQCGLSVIERIERGIAWHIARADGSRLSERDTAALRPLIHDRMTETVLDTFDAAAQLLHHYPPQHRGEPKRRAVRVP